MSLLMRDRIRTMSVQILLCVAAAGCFLGGRRLMAQELAPAAASTDARQADLLTDPARTVAARAARGGGQQADFDSLIELIQSTIAPDTWEDVGGEGTIAGFPGGVFVDPAGVLRSVDRPLQQKLTTIWNASPTRFRGADGHAGPSHFESHAEGLSRETAATDGPSAAAWRRPVGRDAFSGWSPVH